MNEERVRAAVETLLAEMGEDPTREGLLRTPIRVAEALKFLTSGYGQDIDSVLNNALFTVECSEMVVVKDIDFYSLCEHHLLPFFGRCHVAYVPDGKVIGLSKLPRLVEVFSRRLQVQERMTRQIADFLSSVLTPHGVAVVVEGMHFCSVMRGVKKHEASMTTSSMLCTFRENRAARSEFHVLLGRSGNGELIG